MFLRHSVNLLGRRWAQRALFPTLVERVMVAELERFTRELENLEAAGVP